ncbi:MAG: sugar phosphate isomerase/epimerase [Candidatus Methanoperedens sp.]|jgi:sugar phosphate isomerase/epimerase|nr:sugar phosphate isomerase/epimerase [Candidatus Methanoperedens sp.]PKL53538.1 MAG: hypothetical protein CVV36_06610 [Candidatus Methanoperedenaceae archaeon HGW-Methanoperedenaceae-1]
MRISCASLFLWEYTLPGIMEILLEAGIRSVEFWAETPDFWMNRNDGTGTVMLEEALSMMPGGCTLHAPVMDLNASSINDNIHEVTISETLWALELAGKIGARAVTIHPGKRTVNRPPVEEDWQKFDDYLKACTQRADAMDIQLALENSMPSVSSMCSSPDEMKTVLDKFPSLFFTFDVVHAYIESPGNAMAFIEELGGRIINVHVGAPHNGKPHYPLHREDNMKEILMALRDRGYDGDLTIEIDDKVYDRTLSKKDKIRELVAERKYLEGIFTG